MQLWRKLVKDYPKEVEARLFLSQRVDQKEKVAILEAILKEDPNNSAANHYYIHALEAGPHPEQALHSAEVLASLAPNSGHMVHMPGHIFSRMGDYARAEQAFAASVLVDERYMEAQHVRPDNDWNYVHNLMYAIENLMEEGKLNQATALSAKLHVARGQLESTLYTYSSRDSISRLGPRLPVALRTADWAQVQALLKAIPPQDKLPNLDFLARQMATFSAGMLAIENHELTKADESSVQFDAALWRVSQKTRSTPGNKAPTGPPHLEVMPDAQLQPLLSTLSIMSMELRASLLAAQGEPADSHEVFLKAAEAEKALGYREPPTYIRPVGETEAAAMMAVGSWSDARAAFEKALAERPRSGFALYGIALTSEKSGDSVAAAKEYADFLAAWKDADPSLDQVIHAKSFAVPPSASR
jgi:tetratricopeptide (TPR) repeat protein